MKWIIRGIFPVLAAISLWIGFEWTINRVYVGDGQSLQVQYKGPILGTLFGKPEYAASGTWAEEGQIGVRRELLGPGRHFLCPIWYKTTIVDDVVIAPGEVGVVTCKLGKDLPAGEFLVDGDIGSTEFKGILRKVLVPGRYRINPHGYTVDKIATVTETSGQQIKHSGWVSIPTGYVGVVTNLADIPDLQQKKGIQPEVLPPGIYPVNGREQQVDIVEVGYRETTVAVVKAKNADGSTKLDESGEPLVDKGNEGINFPSSDGFPIQMDYTAVWGLMPDQAPHAVSTFGNVDQVENKVILPQIESICRNNGSRYTAVQMLVGADREKFQQQTMDNFRTILTEKKITLEFGLVRHIYVPIEVRKPIQSAFVADELTLTREQEQQTARAEALFREAEKNVELEKERVVVDTDRQCQGTKAEGDRKAKQVDAQTARQVAEIARETAELKAQAVQLLGEAENDGKRMIEEAKSEKFKLAVQAFGSANAYNDWVFATGLPNDIKLTFLYAGQGTLWTDLGDVGLRANVALPELSGQAPPPRQPQPTASDKKVP